MQSIEQQIRRAGWFLRRCDLLRRGFTDRQLRAALAAHRIFRVRHGWYSVPRAPQAAVRAVRVGGRLTGLSALESAGIPVPHSGTLSVAVAPNACRHRNPDDRRRRLEAEHDVRIVWVDSTREHHANSWRVPLDEALLHVLATESRDIAVACASAVVRHKRWSRRRLEHLFARAPRRASAWLQLVGERDDSHGETFARLWLRDAGIPTESQPHVEGVGRLDLRVSDHVYVEIDGAQHDPSWTGETVSSFERDRDRDMLMTSRGNTTLRFTYRQLYGNWAGCLAAIERAIADDRELTARRVRDPRVPRSARPRRKRRSSHRDGSSVRGSPLP